MREVRKKQKNFYKFLKSLVIFSVVFIFIYIGAQPYVKSFNETLAVAVNYASISLLYFYIIQSTEKLNRFLRTLKMNLKTQVIILILVIKKALNKDA